MIIAGEFRYIEPIMPSPVVIFEAKIEIEPIYVNDYFAERNTLIFH